MREVAIVGGTGGTRLLCEPLAAKRRPRLAIDAKFSIPFTAAIMLLKGNVTLDTVYQHLGSIYGGSMPPGVTIDDRASQTLLTGEQTKGHITLKAAPDAKPVEKQQVPVMAHVSINFVVKTAYASAPIFVTVRPKRGGVHGK